MTNFFLSFCKKMLAIYIFIWYTFEVLDRMGVLCPFGAG